MTKDKVVGFYESTAKRILNRLGSTTEQSFPEWNRGRASPLLLFVLAEDVEAGASTVKVWSGELNGTTVVRSPNESEPFDLVNIAGALDGATAGYFGTMASLGGGWIPISTYECIDPPCAFPAGSSFTAPTLPDGVKDTAYGPVPVSGTNVTVAVTGLPAGLSFGSSAISGTPTEKGVWWPTVTATAGSCTKTKLVRLEILE